MTPALAQRISELRACDNVGEVRIVAMDGGGARALVLLLPLDADDDSGELLLVDPALCRDQIAH